MNSTAFTQCLESFDFANLFRNELGWDILSHGIPVSVGEQVFDLAPVAQKRGVQVLHCAAPEGASLPDYALRQRIERALTREAREHLLIFTDAARTSQIWQWVDRKPGQPARYREVKWQQHQSAELLRQKMSAISFDIGEETSLTVVGVTQRLRGGFDREKVTKKFYVQFKDQRDALEKFVEGIPAAAGDDRRWYTAVLINRLMFIWFLQEKGFLDGDKRYLRNRLERHEAEGSAKSFYLAFLCPLFFRGFATPRTPETAAQIAAEFGNVPYLNGGLFSKHELEEKYEGALEVSNAAFASLFAFFDKWDWHLDERLRSEAEVKQSGKLGEINPDVLGYIFEKFVNEKENPKGAYYTKEDITEYIGRNTIIPALFHKVRAQHKAAFDALAWPLLQQEPDKYIYPAMLKGVDLPYTPDIEAGRDTKAPDLLERRKPWNGKTPEPWGLPTEIWRETVARHDRAREVRAKLAIGEVMELGDLITYNLNIRQWAQDVIERCTDLPLLRDMWTALAGRLPRKHGEKYRHGLSVLDPTCGSGAFLFAALQILKPLYDAALGTMVSLQADALMSGQKQHPDKWADIDETIARFFADQTDKQRDYAVIKHIIVNNLYGVDLEEQATEIAKLRLFLKLVALLEPGDAIEPLPDIDFNIRHGNTLVGYATEEETERAVKGATQGNLFSDAWEDIRIRLKVVEESYNNFQIQQVQRGGHITPEDKQSLVHQLHELEESLNWHLCCEYGKDPSKGKQFDDWKASHKPFHWYVDFYPLMAAGGFDVVIGNPPYVELHKVEGYTPKVSVYPTAACGNLYAPMLERDLTLTKPEGRLGQIVPISCVATSRMQPLRDAWANHQTVTWLSHYSGDAHPSVLFNGVKFRLTIVLQEVRSKSPQELSTTGFQRWFPEARDSLFTTIEYARAGPKYWRLGLVPKANAIALQCLDAVARTKEQIASRLASNPSHIAYAHRIVAHYVKAFDFVPYFKSERDGEKRSEDYKPFGFKSQKEVNAFAGVLNSSIFYLWFVAYSDVYHCGRDLILDFPFPFDHAVDSPAFLHASSELMDAYKRTAVRRRIPYERTGLVEYDEFYPRKVKNFVDDVDGQLAQILGLKPEHLDYVVNYDIKYRMGQGADEDDS